MCLVLFDGTYIFNYKIIEDFVKIMNTRGNGTEFPYGLQGMRYILYLYETETADTVIQTELSGLFQKMNIRRTVNTVKNKVSNISHQTPNRVRKNFNRLNKAPPSSTRSIVTDPGNQQNLTQSFSSEVGPLNQSNSNITLPPHLPRVLSPVPESGKTSPNPETRKYRKTRKTRKRNTRKRNTRKRKSRN